MGINLNFSNVASREPLPEGIHLLQIKKAEETVSSNNKDMLKVQFYSEEYKSSVFENFLYQENTLWKLKNLLEAVGYDVTGAIDFNPTELEGQFVKCKVTQELYEGSPVNRIKKFIKA